MHIINNDSEWALSNKELKPLQATTTIDEILTKHILCMRLVELNSALKATTDAIIDLLLTLKAHLNINKNQLK